MATLGRRILSITSVFLLVPLLIVLTPVAFVVGSLIDLLGRRRALPTFRLWLFAIVFVVHECVVSVYAGWLWLRGGFGRSLDIPHHSRVQGRWVGSLLTWAGRLLDVRVQWPDPANFPDGKILVLSRHASMVDAVIPAHLFPSRLHRPVHYVLKRELRWLPSIDVYGHRLGNHFVDRDGDTEREVAAIVDLYERAEPNAGVVIFPEGTYSTPKRRQRVMASLQRKGDTELLDFASSLDHLLPPKPAGALALLRRADDVVIFGHVGLEGMAEFSGLRTHLPLTSPVLTRAWPYHIADLPKLDAARGGWLRDQWADLDAWVAEQHRVVERHRVADRPIAGALE